MFVYFVIFALWPTENEKMKAVSTLYSNSINCPYNCKYGFLILVY